MPRAHQYFGLKAAQAHVKQRKAASSGTRRVRAKASLMVLLAKWVLETNPSARVLMVTDRDELDKQIEQVFAGVGEQVSRTRSGGN